jgi:hypothetical protein
MSVNMSSATALLMLFRSMLSAANMTQTHTCPRISHCSLEAKLTTHHNLPIHLPPHRILLAPGPAKARIERGPVLPLRVDVKPLQFFHVIVVPDAGLCCYLFHGLVWSSDPFVLETRWCH